MRLPDAKVAIVNATPFCLFEGRHYLAPSELTSLAQWFPLFGHTLLLKPQVLASKLPKGWLPLPDDIEIVPLCLVSDAWRRRLSNARVAAEKSLPRVDLLYARMPNYEGYRVFQVAQRLEIPLLLELHGDWVSAIREEDQRSLLRRVTRWGREMFAEHAVRQMARYASAIVTIGPELKEKYSPRRKATLVSTNHLLPQAFYSPREDFRLKSPPLILFVGDIQRRKGLLVLFKALNRLKIMGRTFQMVLIGDGPLKHELQIYAGVKGFDNTVVFAGRLPHGPHLFSWFKKADLFVLPSVAAEGVPRVTHEAMAMGCPVIATDIGSVAWQLQGGAGIVVEPQKSDALAGAICKVFDKEDLRRDLSEKGYRRALAYTLERQQTSLAEFVKAYLARENLRDRSTLGTRGV